MNAILIILGCILLLPSVFIVGFILFGGKPTEKEKEGYYKEYPHRDYRGVKPTKSIDTPNYVFPYYQK